MDREEGVDRDIALLIADGMYNRLKSSNIRECVRIARLAKNDSSFGSLRELMPNYQDKIEWTEPKRSK